MPHTGLWYSGKRSSSGAVHNNFLYFWYSVRFWRARSCVLRKWRPSEVSLICHRLSTRQQLLRRWPCAPSGDWWIYSIPWIMKSKNGENEDVVRATPSGDAPNTSARSTMLLPNKMRLIIRCLTVCKFESVPKCVTNTVHRFNNLLGIISL